MTKMPLVIWLPVVIIFDKSFRLLSTHMREDIHATSHYLHCQ